jgi:hypothetical protein
MRKALGGLAHMSPVRYSAFGVVAKEVQEI